MQSEDVLIEKCKHLIEEKTGWGNSESWKNQDFTELSEKIYEETKINLSPTTLKRVWGKVKYESLPNLSTLNTLASFVGYENWREFKLKSIQEEQPRITVPQTEVVSQQINPPKTEPRFQTKSIGVFSLILLLAGAGWLTIQTFSKADIKKESQSSTPFSFTSKPVTKGIPNSVVFTYDATAATTDSVFIQQSWDPKRRVQVPKNKHQYTSIYYYPGFFKAKLVVGDRIVKEHDLLIPSDGWIVAVQQEPVPVYFSEQETRKNGTLGLSPVQIEAKHIPMQPQPPFVIFRNVRDFKGILNDNFIFETEVKSNYNQGSAICQFSQIMLLLENDMMSIPLSNLGCVSDLNMSVGDKFMEGKTTDLSGFGSDMSHWTKVRVESRNKKVQFFINGKKALETSFSNAATRIVGIHYGFQGTGSIRYTKLQRLNGEVVYEENFQTQTAM
ncbi:hypothetical protein [Xanthocytophaga flava]|uniref:hypothetical protein n=1 Tax=Xanthocytophaga flava TaxID=3048013 RepID=UPI0028D324EB|nr:hypothetical protein [Xanthocytophaga flavus]MDJ1472246.1 hypothetical protein [Xanthocytophaga flavus]